MKRLKRFKQQQQKKKITAVDDRKTVTTIWKTPKTAVCDVNNRVGYLPFKEDFPSTNIYKYVPQYATQSSAVRIRRIDQKITKNYRNDQQKFRTQYCLLQN